MRAVRLDATHVTADDLKVLDVRLVVDAAGPFQGAEPVLAWAALSVPMQKGSTWPSLARACCFFTETAARSKFLLSHDIFWKPESTFPHHALTARADPVAAMRAANAQASERIDEQGRFRFDVGLFLPWIGLRMRYRSWLVPEQRKERG